MHLSQAVEGYLLHRSTELSPETLKTERTWLHQLADHLGDVDVANVTADQVRDWLLHQKNRGLALGTVRRCHTSTSAFYTWAMSDDVQLADHDPTDAVPPPKLPKRVPKALTQETVEALLAVADQMRLTRRCRALVLFLVDSGCRCSETIGVTMDDINLKTGKVLVTGKGDKQRYTFIGRRARSAVWLYVSGERPDPQQLNEDRLFLTETGYPMSRWCLYEAIKRLAEKAGVDGVSVHAFRHTCAVNHLKNGMNLVALQHLLGHSDIVTTRHYLDAIADEDVQQTAERTSPSDNWKL